MTSLLGEVESSKSKHKQQSKSKAQDSDEYNLSRFKKSSSIIKSKSKLISNKGIDQRIKNDQIDSKFKISKTKKTPTINDQLVNDALTRKALIYEATIQGRSGGLSEKQLESSSLNIEAKRQESEIESPILIRSPSPTITSFKGKFNSSLNDEEQTEDIKLEEEEEWIESQDEFGRTTLIRIQDLPKLKSDPQRSMKFIQTESAQHLNQVEAEYGPQRSFPILDPTTKPIRPNSPIEKYFNPKAEQRQLGIGHYNLSSNPIERQNQQDELKSREIETQEKRSSIVNQSEVVENSILDRKRLIQLKREELMARKKVKSNE